MASVLFTIGSINIYGYGTMIALGMILGVALLMQRGKKYNLDSDAFFNLAIIDVLAGIIGSKLLYWIVEFDQILEDPSFIIHTLTGGFVIYGGLIGGVIATIIYFKKIKKTTVLDKMDLAIASVALAQGFGRIGCLLAGCCYGLEAPEGAWYAITFPEGAAAPTGVGLYPVQLIAAVALILLFLILVLVTDRTKFSGEVVTIYMVLYSIGRFFIEYLRNDDRGEFLGLSTSQFISIVIFLGGIALFVVLKKLNYPPINAVLNDEEEIAETVEEVSEETAVTVEEKTEETVETAEEVAEVTGEKTEE